MSDTEEQLPETEEQYNWIRAIFNRAINPLQRSKSCQIQLIDVLDDLELHSKIADELSEDRNGD